ncbi:MAG: hypothetical protein ACJAXJ_003026 [Colwellia sp.]|jgi:hypothetical protein
MNRLTILVSIIVVMFVLLDFNERFLADNHAKQLTKKQQWQDNMQRPPQLSAQQKQQLQQVTENINSENDSQVITTQGLALAAQQLQQGVLTRLYIGDWLYELSAIIYPENQQELAPFAILKATNVKDNQQTVNKVINASQLSSYRVNINGTKHVEFVDAEQGRKVLLTMYKSNLADNTN